MPTAQKIIVATLAGLAIAIAGTRAPARTLLKNLCRVKGQEENTLQGYGLVVGLKGTGDSAASAPTVRMLAQVLQLMGSPVGKRGPLELKEDVKNVALVLVTATVPAAGARQGDAIDCVVSSAGGAKSLTGGQLFMTPLVGPRVDSERIYAFAQGAIHLDNDATPTAAKVFKGCRLEEDFFNPFVKDNKFTLVLNKNKADFQVAQDVADLINGQLGSQSQESTGLAHAIDQVNIVVTLPPQYKERPVWFISQVLSLPILDPQTEARVVINEKAGSVVVSGDVEIGEVTITHKNMVIDLGGQALQGGPAPSKFVSAQTGPAPSPKLKALTETLNSLKTPPADVIEIIKGLERAGKLHATLIIE